MIKDTSGYKKGNMRLRQPVLKYPATEWRVPHSVQHSEGQKKNIKYNFGNFRRLKIQDPKREKLKDTTYKEINIWRVLDF